MTRIAGGIDLASNRHSQVNRSGDIKLDWKAYFYKFIVEHGEPINYDGRLLFSDGWQYSATEYAGPEFPPPKDVKELRRLQQAYWGLQYDKYRVKYDQLWDRIKALKDWQERMSLPLQQRAVYHSEDDNVLKLHEPEDLDLSGLKYQLEDLRVLTQEAKDHLLKV